MEVVNVKVTVDEVTKVTTLRAVTILQEPGLFSLGQWFLTFFTYPTLLSDKITRFIPNTLNGSFIKNTKLPHSYSLKWFIKIYVCCNLWFSKFIPGANLPHVKIKNHCTRSLPCPYVSTSFCLYEWSTTITLWPQRQRASWKVCSIALKKLDKFNEYWKMASNKRTCSQFNLPFRRSVMQGFKTGAAVVLWGLACVKSVAKGCTKCAINCTACYVVGNEKLAQAHFPKIGTQSEQLEKTFLRKRITPWHVLSRICHQENWSLFSRILLFLSPPSFCGINRINKWSFILWYIRSSLGWRLWLRGIVWPNKDIPDWCQTFGCDSQFEHPCPLRYSQRKADITRGAVGRGRVGSAFPRFFNVLL